MATKVRNRVSVVESVGETVDRLGEVKSQIAELEKLAEILKETLVESGETEVEGSLFRATVVRATVTKVDWKSVAEYLKPSSQLLTAHTSESERTTVRVVSR